MWLTKVGYCSFENCNSLTTINFSTGLNIVLPQTVKYMGDNAFSGYRGNRYM